LVRERCDANTVVSISGPVYPTKRTFDPRTTQAQVRAGSCEHCPLLMADTDRKPWRSIPNIHTVRA